MKALSVALNARVSLTVLGNAGEWRFGSWKSHDGTLLPPPPDAARITFGSPLAAADFFRTLHVLNMRKELTALFFEAA